MATSELVDVVEIAASAVDSQGRPLLEPAIGTLHRRDLQVPVPDTSDTIILERERLSTGGMFLIITLLFKT
jgi:hypothetical protein